MLNADDARVAALPRRWRAGAVLTFGLGAEAQFRARAIEDRGAEGSTFELESPVGSGRFVLPLPGRHNVENALAALAAASVWGISAADAAEVFPRLRPERCAGGCFVLRRDLR